MPDCVHLIVTMDCNHRCKNLESKSNEPVLVSPFETLSGPVLVDRSDPRGRGRGRERGRRVSVPVEPPQLPNVPTPRQTVTKNSIQPFKPCEI